MGKKNSYGLSRDYFTNRAEPSQIDEYREQTSRMIPYNFKTKLCPVCRKQRSAGQFPNGRIACLRCPEPKE